MQLGAAGGLIRRMPATWWIVFVGFFAVIAAWSVSHPVFGFPDELAHVRKADAVARGQWLGQDDYVKTLVNRSGRFHPVGVIPYRKVKAPAWTADLDIRLLCLDYQPARSARCVPPIRVRHGLTTQRTYVGAYPPLYYVLVGWLSRGWPGVTGVYLMRLLSAAINAAFLGAAVEVARRYAGRMAAVGVMVAATPAALSIAGAVNPSGLEVATAICLWSTTLALARLGRRSSLGLVVLWTLSAVVLTGTRGLSPGWMVGILVAGLVFADTAQRRELLTRRGLRWGAALTGLVLVLSIIWVVAAKATRIAGVPAAPGTSNAALLQQRLGLTWGWMQETLAPWSTGFPPMRFVVIAWLVAMAVLVALGAMALSLVQPRALLVRRAAVWLGAGVAWVAVPIVATMLAAHTSGAIWRGRYTEPAAAGIPIIGGFLLAEAPAWRQDRRGRPAAAAVLTLVGVAGIVDLLAFLRRFMVGVHGPVDFFTRGAWHPVLPAAFVVALAVGGTALLAAAVAFGNQQAGGRRTPAVEGSTR